MKKSILILAVIACTWSCNSDKKEINKPKSADSPGIPNVNGNIPDTVNSLNLKNRKMDSTVTYDSIK